jgi:hypothetical protein
LRVNLDRVTGTGKIYILLQASKKVEDIAIITGRRDLVLRAALTGITAYSSYGYTLYSLFKIPVKIPLYRLSWKLLRANLCSLQALFKHY